jgi:transcription antitermination factor NusG
MKALGNEYCWVVSYIDSEYLPIVKQQLGKFPEYKDVEAYIPTIKVLKKTFKGQNIFEEVPLLFNYGFFKIPRKYAIHSEYLANMQKNISCIYGWVKDGANRKNWAIVTPHEIAELIRATVNIGAHSSEDLNLLKPGELITLRGYPFDGVPAEFISMDEKKRKVKVKIVIFDQIKEVEVSFDNVFFTIYHNKNYDENQLSKNSLDAMEANNTLDKFTNKHIKK